MRRIVLLAVCLSASLMSACTSSSVLEPSAIAPAEKATAAETQSALLAEGSSPGTAPSSTAPTTATAAIPTAPAFSFNKRIQIAPLIGPSVAAATPLTERLADRIRAGGMTLAPSTDTAPGTVVMRGYFSTMPEDDGTTVIYVWDVYDTAGNRLHRINGQAKAGKIGSDWNAIPAATMQTIADATVAQLTAWLGARRG